MVVPVRFAAEQRRSVACGETAGRRDVGKQKLLSSDVDLATWADRRRCSAASHSSLAIGYHTIASTTGLQGQWRGLQEFHWLSHDAGLSPSGCGHNQSKNEKRLLATMAAWGPSF